MYNSCNMDDYVESPLSLPSYVNNYTNTSRSFHNNRLTFPQIPGDAVLGLFEYQYPQFVHKKLQVTPQVKKYGQGNFYYGNPEIFKPDQTTCFLTCGKTEERLGVPINYFPTYGRRYVGRDTRYRPDAWS